MDFELITHYDVIEIVKFLDKNPQVWNKEPDPNVHNAPNYKSIKHKDYPELESLINPIIKDLVIKYGGNAMQASITSLPSQEDIRLHRDEASALRRFHIPIQTNDQVIFYCGNSAINMKVGECWEFNYKQWHKVVNSGTTDRIHLMVDLSDE